MNTNFFLKRILPFILFILLVLIVFKSFFTAYLLAGGDFQFNFTSMYSNYSLYPYAWDGSLQNGFGGFTAPLLWTSMYFSFPIFLFGQLFHLPWNIVERLGYFYPFLLVSFFSSYILFKKFFPKNSFALLSPFIFIFNTYALLLISGQAKVGLGYSLVPFILWGFINLMQKKTVVSALTFGLLFGLALFMDIRMAYVAVVACALFFLYDITSVIRSVRFYILILFAISCAVLLNAFWILPTFLVHINLQNEIGSATFTDQSVQYFSFAKFENTISLLHPNWPENIFGKVYFMRPEFLFIPILAFAGLFFITKNGYMAKWSNSQKKNITIKPFNNKAILYFALLGFVGAFLAKGTNDPFGGIYLWMFDHIPGFIMFRDPTKWYTLVAISYSVLIPFTVWKIYEFLQLHHKLSIFNFQFSFKSKIFNLQNIFLVTVILYFLFLIRPAFQEQLRYAFKPTVVPSEYVTLENFLLQQHQFSRTLWVPTTQRFGFFSPKHPEVSVEDLLSVYDEKSFMEQLTQPGIKKTFQQNSLKYIIVPYDSEHELFLQSSSYDNQEYLQTISDLQKITWLKRLNGFGRIAVFEVPQPNDPFSSSDTKMKITYIQVSPVEYRVVVTNARKGDRLVFSESFDPHWTLESSKYYLVSSMYDSQLNAFLLPQSGNYTFEVYYTPQKWMNVGVWITLGSIVLIAGSLFVLRKRNKNG